MVITARFYVTPKRDGRVLYKGKVIGVVKKAVPGRYGKGPVKSWECLSADGISFIQQCDTRREGIVRLLIIAGALS